jgi:hypothetical protein
MSMRNPLAITLVLCAGCPGGGGQPDASPPAEILDPEPAGAPAETVQASDPDLGCLGVAETPAPGTAGELTGYVRTLADPTAMSPPPPARVEAYTPAGSLLGFNFADASKQGRVAVPVAFAAGDGGFVGYAVVTMDGYLDYRFQTNRLVAAADFNGYAWLVTPAEVDTWATTLGITVDPGKGILLGSMLDCQAFALENVVIQVAGATDGVGYPQGPTPIDCPTLQNCARPFADAPGATFTNETGRFLLANLAPGPVTVKAFGRLEAGGPLTLLAAIDTEITAGAITAVGLRPRQGVAY